MCTDFCWKINMEEKIEKKGNQPILTFCNKAFAKLVLENHRFRTIRKMAARKTNGYKS